MWNDEHCRNKRIMIDDQTRMALASDRPATLATYRMELGDKWNPVEDVYVPLWFKGPGGAISNSPTATTDVPAA